MLVWTTLLMNSLFCVLVMEHQDRGSIYDTSVRLTKFLQIIRNDLPLFHEAHCETFWHENPWFNARREPVGLEVKQIWWTIDNSSSCYLRQEHNNPFGFNMLNLGASVFYRLCGRLAVPNFIFQPLQGKNEATEIKMPWNQYADLEAHVVLQ